MRSIKCFVPLFFIGFSSLSAQTNNTSAIRADQILNDIKYLSSDELEGRLTGTAGNEKAAKYVAAAMMSTGLMPAGDSGTFFQHFDFVSSVKLGPSNSMRIEGNGAKQSDLQPDVVYHAGVKNLRLKIDIASFLTSVRNR